MIKSITFKNIQSIENVTYEFIQGLNVIVADNNTGKSVLLKGIDFMVNFDKLDIRKRKQYITFGKHTSTIIVDILEGGTYEVEMNINRIAYYAVGPTGHRTYLGNQMPGELFKGLGLVVCSNGFIGNIITDEQSKLLVNSDDEINTQILGLLAIDDEAENIIDNIDIRISELNRQKGIVSAQLHELNALVLNKSRIDTTHLEFVATKLTLLTRLIGDLESPYNYTQNIRDVKVPSEYLGEVFELMDELDRIHFRISDVVPVENKLDIDLINSIADLENFYNALDNKCSLLENITTVNPTSLGNNYFGLLSRIENLITIIDDYQEVTNCDKQLLDSADEISLLYDGIKNLLNKVEEIDILVKESNEIKEQLNSIDGEVYDCPIYGSIKYVDEECIPNISGLTLVR